MSIDGLIAPLEASRLADTIRNSLLLFPLIESLHVIALTMVFGTIAIVDLRLLGLASARRPFSRLAFDTLRWTWWAFTVAAVTGALMFITNATVYYHNFYFRAKMIMLALSGLNTLLFQFTALRSVDQWNNEPAAPAAGRAAAIISLLLWVSIIFAGRWIGFTTTRASSVVDPGVDIEQLLPK